MAGNSSPTLYWPYSDRPKPSMAERRRATMTLDPDRERNGLLQPGDEQLLIDSYTARTQGAPYVVGAQPTRPSVEQMAAGGPPTALDEVRSKVRSAGAMSPRGQQMRADDAGFRQRLAGIDRRGALAELDALPPEQKQQMADTARANPLFLRALAARMGMADQGSVNALQNYFGIRPQLPPLPSPQLSEAPPEEPMPSGMALYAGNAGGIEDRTKRLNAMPPRSRIQMYQR